jgi:hypothetical protein
MWMTRLRHAFKEWASICTLLAEGKQTLLLRKGGIAETEGVFRLEHDRFWLFPTYLHQQREALVEAAWPAFERSLETRPPAGTVYLSHFAELVGCYQVHDIVGALRLTGLHGFSQETVTSRFHYRTPGLHVLAVRVYRSNTRFEVVDQEAYAGCRTWVELDQDLPAEGTAVLDAESFRAVIRDVERRLEPTALV